MVRNRMGCKGICNFSEYRVAPDNPESVLGESGMNKKAGRGPYSIEGVMLCIVCEVFFQTEGKFNLCPCCHAKMRAGPRPSGRSELLARRKERAREIKRQRAKQRAAARSSGTTLVLVTSKIDSRIKFFLPRPRPHPPPPPTPTPTPQQSQQSQQQYAS